MILISLKERERETAYQAQLFDVFFTYLSRNTDDMYMMFDHETETLEYVSPNLERVLGITPEELIDYFWDSDLAAGEDKRFLENAYCVEIQGRKKRVSYLADRTKERKNLDNLADALRMAQAANDAKSAFLSSVSHDIRTPMNAIIGFLALMRDEVNNPGAVMEYITSELKGRK